MNSELLLRLILLLSGTAGFLISYYISHKKGAKQVLVCPIGSHCDPVVHSQFSTIFSIPLEKLGLFYYGATTLFYVIQPSFEFLQTPAVTSVGILAALGAFLFSIYLTFIQIFNLKKLCTWCLASAALSTVIFFIVVFSSPYGLGALALEYKLLFVFLHLLSFAVGVGGATIADVFFFRFLKDFKISESEADILNTLSEVIWCALGLIVISGIGLFLPRSEELLLSSKFLLKMSVVAVIIINGAVLNLLVAPRIVQICFGGGHDHEKGEHHNLRKVAVALGAVSIVSWYTAVFLGMMPSIPVDYAEAMLIYGGVLVAAIVGSQVVDHLRYA